MDTVSTVAFSQGKNNFNIISIILLVFMDCYACSSVQNERFQLNCKDVKENGSYKISTPSSFNKGWNASDLSEENWVSNNTNIAVIVFHAMALERNSTEEVLGVNPGEIILHQCMNVTLIIFLHKGLEIRIDFILVPEETTDTKWIGGVPEETTDTKWIGGVPEETTDAKWIGGVPEETTDTKWIGGVSEETTDAKWIGGETHKRTGLVVALILFGSVIVVLFCSCIYKRSFNRIKSKMQHATNI